MSLRAATLLVVVGGALAIGLRAWVMASPFGALDGDEAVWGLMALHVFDGEVSSFFWGQAYGGTHEVLLSAPVLALAGASTAPLRAVPLALFAAATVLVWRVGRRTVGEPAARLAALLFVVWPAYLVWKSAHAHGFYGAGLVLSLLVVLFALRLAELPRAADLFGLGLAAGLGWWATPQTAFVAVPTLAWLVATRPTLLRRSWIAMTAAAVGAVPWLTWNIVNDWRSLSAPFGRGDDTYLDHLETFIYATLPTQLGLRVPFSLDWLTGELIGRAVEVAVIAALIVIAARRSRLLLLLLVAYPLLAAMSPHASLNEEPRYLVLFAPVIALLTAAPLAAHWSIAVAGTSALATLTIAGLISMSAQEPPVPPVGGLRSPAELEPALNLLDRERVRFALAPYRIAHRITFLSGERIIAGSTGQVRYEPHNRVARRNRHAVVFVTGEGDELRKGPLLRRLGYRRQRAGDLAVYLPPRAR